MCEASGLRNAGRWRRAGVVSRVLAEPCIWVILLYRVTLSPFIGRQCRFEPTCSAFGVGAYRKFGVYRGTLLTAGRVLRCRPGSVSGYDPVPLDRAEAERAGS